MSVGKQHYNINLFLMLLIGLWPCQYNALQNTQRIIISVFLTMCVLIQLTALTMAEFTTDLLFDVLCYVCPYLGFTVKYVCYCFNIDTVVNLMNKLENDWKILKYDAERQIMEIYARKAWLYTVICSLTVYGAGSFLGFIQILPIILDAVAPLNQSRPRNFLIPAIGMLVNDGMSNEIALFFLLASSSLGITVMLATNTTYLAYIRHLCGLFKVTSFRIHYIINQNTSSLVASKGDVNHSRIREIVEVHNRAIEFCEYLRTNFVISYLILLSLGVVALSIHLFQFFQAIMMFHDKSKLILSGIFVFVDFLYVFLGNFVGQTIIDYSKDIFDNAYDTQWYNIPLGMQKSILIIMQRSMKCSTLLLGGIFVPSLEGFATVLSMSISYFTLFYSVQGTE